MGEELGKESESMTVEPSEVAPLSEVLGEVTTEEEKIDWFPLENSEIAEVLDSLAEGLLKIKGVEIYRNPGKSDYFGFRTGNMKGIAFIYLSKKSARVSVGEVERVNGRIRGVFPKHRIYRATESGFTQDGNKVKVSTIIAQVKGYAKDRGW